jgi:O-antigen/teichoic acid export membrane protein
MVLTGWAVIPLVFSPAFAASYLPMILLLPGSALLGASAVLSNELVARGFPGTVSLAALAAFLLTVVLDLALIRAFGMAGAAVASSLAYAAYALAVIALYLGRTGIRAGPFLAAAPAMLRVRLG